MRKTIGPDAAMGGHPAAANETTAPALREIGGRIKKLTYSDMMTLSELFSAEVASTTPTTGPDFAQLLLTIAGKLESV